MKSLVLILIGIVFAFLMSGCTTSTHTGRVFVYDGDGKVLKQYKIILDRPMLMKVSDGEVVIKGDSRSKGLIESLSMSLGLYKGDGVMGYDYGY